MRTLKILRFEAPDPDAGMTFDELIRALQEAEHEALRDCPVAVAVNDQMKIRSLALVVGDYGS